MASGDKDGSHDIEEHAPSKMSATLGTLGTVHPPKDTL